MNLLKQLFSSFTGDSSGVRRVAPVEAAQLVADGMAVLIDVREPSEWSGGVAAPAHLLALSELGGTRRRWRPFLARHRDRELIVYCHSGARSASAARMLASEGFRVANLGGLRAWTSAGLPMRQP